MLISLMLLQFAVWLGGCTPSVAVDQAERARIESAVTAEFGYETPLHFLTIWRASGDSRTSISCGEFASPPDFDGDPPTIRFTYDGREPIIEMHRLWLPSSGTTLETMRLHREAFNRLWDLGCGPNRPGQLSTLFGKPVEP